MAPMQRSTWMILFQAHLEWRFNAPDSSFLGFSIFLEGVTVVEPNKGVPRIGVSGNGTVERFILAFDPEKVLRVLLDLNVVKAI